MSTQLCKELIKIIPHATALLSSDNNGSYELIESNQKFDSIFNIDKSHESSLISVIQSNDNPLSYDLVNVINDMQWQNETVQELSGYNVVLDKVNLEEKEYLFILLFDATNEVQSAISGYQPSAIDTIDKLNDDKLLSDSEEQQILDNPIYLSNKTVRRKREYFQKELKNMYLLALYPESQKEEAEKVINILINLYSGQIMELQGKKHVMSVMVDSTQPCDAKQELIRKCEFQEILISLASRYINCSLKDIEKELQSSLELVGNFVGADRVYIFDYDHQANTTSNTFEWCNIGIESQIEYLQNISLDSVPDWIESHRQGKSIIIPDVSILDGKQQAVKDILQPQGIKSLITIPMMFEEKCLGYVGFDAVKEKHQYTSSEIDLLKFYAQILTNIHLRQVNEQDIWAAVIKAEKANIEKNYFIAKTSHEMRNPLNGAWGFLNLLSELIQGVQERTYLSNSIESLNSAINILNDLLDISRIETNELKLKSDEIDIFALMSESIIPYKQIIKNQGIKLDIKLDSDIPRYLLGDFNRLKQILGNLVLNSVTHAQATTVEMSCHLKNQTSDIVELLFTVKDNGIGMSKETLNQIFNLFYKNNSNSPGSGLGLPICREFINLMGGEIWAESIENIGSDFYFSVPLRLGKTDDIMRSHAKYDENKDLKGVRILLAEDNVTNQTLVVEMLKPREILITAVSNGVEALKALESHPFDLILMDIQMPNMDGLEATKHIRETQNPIPIIALTGSVLPQEKELYISSGINSVVEKPIFIDVLLKKIRIALNKEIR